MIIALKKKKNIFTENKMTSTSSDEQTERWTTNAIGGIRKPHESVILIM